MVCLASFMLQTLVADLCLLPNYSFPAGIPHKWAVKKWAIKMQEMKKLAWDNCVTSKSSFSCMWRKVSLASAENVARAPQVNST